MGQDYISRDHTQSETKNFPKIWKQQDVMLFHTLTTIKTNLEYTEAGLDHTTQIS